MITETDSVPTPLSSSVVLAAWPPPLADDAFDAASSELDSVHSISPHSSAHASGHDAQHQPSIHDLSHLPHGA